MTHPTDTAKSDELKACPTWQDREEANRIRLAMEDGDWGLQADAHDWSADHPLLQAIAAWNRRSSPPQNDAGGVIASLRKRYLAGARDSSGARKDRTRCSHYVQVLDELSAAIRTPLSELQALRQEFEAWWRSMDSAPRDGRYILAIVAPNRGRHLEHQAGRMFAIRHEGKTVSDYDLGWAVYPGFGGASDHDFTHWMPIPSAPSGEG
ncbi:hypothetical protein [Sphingobium sp. HDIP04]|uniref:hypothetical protein n=1 Tax=Sphingobium sp. HDIP04 TaxID=428994 RepID=UPI0003878469|nr:hypothetical protein [Sphingobium sp. HDIP04]EQB03874.1 hypothetical protein L286_10950 [Sphingobium sp. HDIP04]